MLLWRHGERDEHRYFEQTKFLTTKNEWTKWIVQRNEKLSFFKNKWKKNERFKIDKLEKPFLMNEQIFQKILKKTSNHFLMNEQSLEKKK